MAFRAVLVLLAARSAVVNSFRVRHSTRSSSGSVAGSAAGAAVDSAAGSAAGSCYEWCNAARRGAGRIIGTSPSCGGSCMECSGACEVVSKENGYSDYGAGCWTGNKVCCCDRVSPSPAPQADQDTLTTLIFNTYLLEVNVVVPVNSKPNLEVRAQGITTWFNMLRQQEVPDVVVLTEIYSAAAEGMMNSICSPVWRKDWFSGSAKFIPCGSGSHFAFATQPVNPTAPATATKSGGVVVLVKQGHEMVSARDYTFEECMHSDCMSNKGFWVVELKKGTQTYWVVGTHTQAWEGTQEAQARNKQFRQMRRVIDQDARIQSGARVVYAGDMNIFTAPYWTEDGEEVYAPETSAMLEALGAPGGPAEEPALQQRGFWLPLESDLNATADSRTNHFVYHLERRYGDQYFDWIVVPGQGDRLQSPTSSKVQFVPHKADYCYPSDSKSGAWTDDLSDHYGVFAELCYGNADCQGAAVVNGHRGATALPSTPDCHAPRHTSCDAYCKSQGHFRGQVFGTSPACGGSCSDCAGECRVIDTRHNFADYGRDCVSGWKVCCCAR